MNEHDTLQVVLVKSFETSRARLVARGGRDVVQRQVVGWVMHAANAVVTTRLRALAAAPFIISAVSQSPCCFSTLTIPKQFILRLLRGRAIQFQRFPLNAPGIAQSSIRVWLVGLVLLIGICRGTQAQISGLVRSDFCVTAGSVYSIIETNGVVYLGGALYDVLI